MLSPLPTDAVLLHLGPFKTGTSAIQRSLEAARPELVAHNVLYPGRGHHQRRPIWWVTGVKVVGRTPPTEGEWKTLRSQVQGHSGRVCISSEDLARAKSPSIHGLVSGLGSDRVHTLAVARPLAKLIPSMWQTRVTTGDTTSYSEYVDAILDPARTHPCARAFWRQHDIGAVIDRWSKSVDVDRQYWMITDPDDHLQLHRVFEGLLALPVGLLPLHEHRNPSLTFEAADMVRHLNEMAVDMEWNSDLYARLVRSGLSHGIRDAPRGPADTAIPGIPSSYRERVAELDAERVDLLQSGGVRTIGNINHLPSQLAEGEVPLTGPDIISMLAVLEGMRTLMESADRDWKRVRAEIHAGPIAAPNLSKTKSSALLHELARRGHARIDRQIRAIRSQL